MATEKVTKDHLPVLLGTFKPTGHVVVMLENDEAAAKFAAELSSRGLGAGDVLTLGSADLVSSLEELLPGVSGAAGFGSEVQSMRQIHHLALEGCACVIVHAEDERAEKQVGDLAREHRARIARKYNLLTVEDLI